MSHTMMPPKKSKAARSDNINGSTEDKPADVVPERAPPPMVESDEEEPPTSVPPKKKHFNMFDVTMIEGKRKRVVFTPEGALNEWIEKYFEDKEETKMQLGEIYNLYIDKCVSEFSNAVEQLFFYKAFKQRFPNGFGHKADSPYADKVKERKVKKKAPKVKADTLSIKIRDIIENTLKELGNPKGGVRFHKLLSHIAGKYPALRIELKPKMLLNALKRGAYFGYLVCEKGIGKCGYYRMYVENEEEEEEKKEEKNDKKKDDKKDGDKNEKDAEKSEEDSADEKKGDKEAAEGEKEESKDKEDKPAKKAAKKPKVPKDRFIHHGSPGRIEDTFYLAMTFGSEPKEASVVRIKNYIKDNYPDANPDRLTKCLDTGKEKGYWDQISGTSGASGKFQMEIASFDPTDDDDLTGMVINAIMACTEPKHCSANTLKKYVMEWYADKWKVADRPHIFRKALERAVANQEIRQLSGIGASGTFQLVKPFTPSPNILAGQDTPSDYENDSEIEESEGEAVESYDFTGYGDKYKPRPSKRRGMARKIAVQPKPAVEINEEEEEAKRKRKTERAKQKRKSTPARGRKRKYADSSESEESSDESSAESSEEEAPPPKKMGPKGPKTAAKGRGRPPAKAAAKKKAAPPPKKAPAKRGRKPAAVTTKKAETPSRVRGRPSRGSYREDNSDSDMDSDDPGAPVEGYRPTPSKSRGGGEARTPPPPKTTPKKKAGGGGGGGKRGRPAKAPAPSRVRTPAAKKQGDDIIYDSDSESDYSDRPAPRVETPAAKKQRSASAPKSRGRRK